MKRQLKAPRSKIQTKDINRKAHEQSHLYIPKRRSGSELDWFACVDSYSRRLVRREISQGIMKLSKLSKELMEPIRHLQAGEHAPAQTPMR